MDQSSCQSRDPVPRCALPRSPRQVIALLRQLQRQSERDRQRLHARLARIAFPAALGDPAVLSSSGARTLTGTDRARRRVAELSAAERHEHLAMNPEPAFSTAQIKAAAPVNRSLLARGITVRSLGIPASAEDQSGWHDGRVALVRHGVATR